VVREHVAQVRRAAVCDDHTINGYKVTVVIRETIERGLAIRSKDKSMPEVLDDSSRRVLRVVRHMQEQSSS